MRLPVAAAVALLLLVLAASALGNRAAFLAAGFCVSGAALSFAMALSVFQTFRNISILALWILSGCVVGLHTAYNRRSADLHLGLPAVEVNRLQGCVKTDPTPLQGGRSFIQIDLETCGDGERKATASGLVTVYLRNRPMMYAGQHVLCDVAGLKRGENGGWLCSAVDEPVFLYWRNSIDRARSSILDTLTRVLRFKAAGEADFLAALLLGIREDPADPLVGMFRRAGVSHVLALSGMHLGIAAGFVLLLAKPLFGKRRAYIITLPLVAAYIWIVGPKPSLLRAGIMYLLLFFRIVGNRRPETLSLLAISLIVALEVDPESFSALSFQLSYLALLGIMTIGPAFARLISPYLPKSVALPLGMSIGAQITTAPVVAGYFGVLYPVGIFASLLISPLIAVYIWSGLIFVLLSFVDIMTGSPQIVLLLSQSVFHVMDQIRRIITVAVSHLSRVPAVDVGNGAAWTIGGVFLCFLLSWRCIEYWHKGRRARFAEKDRQNPCL